MMVQTVSALLVVLGAIALLRGALALSGRLRGAGTRARLRVTETCLLPGRQRLHVVDVDGRRLLLGAADGSIRVLTELGPASDAGAREADLLLAPRRAPAERDAGEPDDAVRRADAGRSRPRRLRGLAPLLGVAALLIARSAAGAEPEGLSQLAGALAGATDPERVSSTLQIVALMTAVSVAPSLLLMATCFTRVLIVLAFLRQAIGVQQLPPGQVLAGLALFVTVFVMAPVAERIRVDAVDPYIGREIDEREAVTRLVAPVRDFMAHSTREKDIELFLDVAGAPAPDSLDAVPMATLLPAYMLSELRTAFEIGFMIYLPFLVIDLVVASMLISVGMIVLPPIVISLPFKLMFFVLLDGWNLVVGSLVAGLRGSAV